MLNEDMIKIFLTETNLSEPELPSTWHDVVMPNDILLSNTTDILTLCKELDEDQRKDMFKTTILAWLFEMPRLTNFSWGWYSRNDGDSYHLISIKYSAEDKKFDKYHIRGTYYNPANMLMFLENKEEYAELLKGALKCCESFYENYAIYSHDLPVNIQVEFHSKIMEKMQAIKGAFAIIGEEV